MFPVKKAEENKFILTAATEFIPPPLSQFVFTHHFSKSKHLVLGTEGLCSACFPPRPFTALFASPPVLNKCLENRQCSKALRVCACVPGELLDISKAYLNWRGRGHKMGIATLPS